jgi:TctA family transporter
VEGSSHQGEKTGDNALVSRRTLICAAAVQTLLVAVLSVALALPLGSAFFKHWGWIVGPVAWMVCSLGTAMILRLPRRRTLIGALLAGVPSAAAVLAGQHTIGEIAAIALFAIWCAWRAPLPIAALNA